MLRPFRIRNLYFDSPDLIDRSGVVQLSSQQYDHEIKTLPEAVITYIDEDDGETVTVGSALELEQRLFEPSEPFMTVCSGRASKTIVPLRIFDIHESARAAAAWDKYVLTNTQLAQKNSIEETRLNLEKSKHGDHQSLVAKVSLLEMEVKLLKEAFRDHTCTAPVRRQEQRPSVFVYPSKNSGLFAQKSPCISQATSPIQDEDPQLGQHRQDSIPVTSRGFQTLGIDAPPHVQRQAHEVRSVRPVGCLDTQHTSHGTDDSHKSICPEAAKVQPIESNNPKDFAAEQKIQVAAFPSHSRALNNGRQESVNTEVIKAPAEYRETRGRGNGNHTIAAHEAPNTRCLGNGHSRPRPFLDAYSDVVPEPCSSLASKQSSFKSLLDLEPEAEIARFPTIFQLEKDGLQSLKGRSSTEHASGNPTASLARANTVTASNPAARLLGPFDPATEAIGVSSNQHSVPRRRGTERYRRRPQPTQPSGTGKTLWEGFERAAPQVAESSDTARKAAGRNESRPLSRPLAQPALSVVRSQSLIHPRPSPDPTVNRLLPMRSALDLSETQRKRQDAIEQSRQRHPTNKSTPHLAQTQTVDSERERINRVQNCTNTLREMGYNPQSRLAIYAEVCDGNISKAMTMAEEDEKASAESRKRAEKSERTRLCARHLREMGYGADFNSQDLWAVSLEAQADVATAVEMIEARKKRRARTMPGSFPWSF